MWIARPICFSLLTQVERFAASREARTGLDRLAGNLGISGQGDSVADGGGLELRDGCGNSGMIAFRSSDFPTIATRLSPELKEGPGGVGPR